MNGAPVNERSGQDPRPRFLCDAMLGRLSTWLRALGYDTAYQRESAPAHLIARAAREERVLLSRNTRVFERRDIQGVASHFVADNDFREQLADLIASFGLTDTHAGRLCLRCNRVLQAVSREAVRRVLPPYVAATQTRFSRCPACRRVYWPATHTSGMADEMRQAFARASEMRGR